MRLSLDFLHGVVDGWTSDSQLQRLYVPVDAFHTYLSRRPPYRPWSPGAYDFLSVDDSTRAGVQACIIARRLGHHVTFFINPYNVITKEPYFFSLLDFTMDTAERRALKHDGRLFNLDDPIDCRRARNVLRAELMLKPLHDAANGVQELARALRCDLSCIPDFVLPPTIPELRMLRDIGVNIESHGWSHLDISRMNDTDFGKHISDARSWLYDVLQLTSTLYAAPFGNIDLTAKRARLLGGPYFLASHAFASGRLNAGGWNRRDVTNELQKGAP